MENAIAFLGQSVSVVRSEEERYAYDTKSGSKSEIQE